MRHLAVDAFDVFIEGLVETKMRVKEAANVSQANCKEMLQDIWCEYVIIHRFKFIK